MQYPDQIRMLFVVIELEEAVRLGAIAVQALPAGIPKISDIAFAFPK